MKTYFISWESGDKHGHCIHEFTEDVTPRTILKRMIEFIEADIPSTAGKIRASQFNRVD